MTPDEALALLPSFLDANPIFLTDAAAASVLEKTATTVFGINPWAYGVALHAYKSKTPLDQTRSETMKLDQIAEVAWNAQASEEGAYTPRSAPKPKLWSAMTLAETTEARARALSILRSPVTHEELNIWAAAKHDSTGYGQGDFPSGSVAFESVCIDLREFWDGVVPRD